MSSMKSADEQTETLRLAMLELNEASTLLEQAEQELANANRAHTACRNRVNTAQKAVDSAMQAIKSNAQSGTSWHAIRHPGFPVIE